jgi:hypothetical protein
MRSKSSRKLNLIVAMDVGETSRTCRQPIDREGSPLRAALLIEKRIAPNAGQPSPSLHAKLT